MSQKTLLAEVIEELEKAILVARKMEKSGTQPAVEIAILLDKIQRSYEMVLLAPHKPHSAIEKQPEKSHFPEPEPKRIIIPEEPATAKREPEQNAATQTIETHTTPHVKPTAPVNKIAEAEKPVTEKPEPTKPAKKVEILGDKLVSGKRFLNDFLQGKSSVQDLSSKLQTKPIKDLTKAFGINDKFQYTRELFNNDSSLFQNTVQTLNEMNSIEDALIYIGAHFQWQADSPTVIKFIEILQRRYL